VATCGVKGSVGFGPMALLIELPDAEEVAGG
jgi:hypothetical protein